MRSLDELAAQAITLARESRCAACYGTCVDRGEERCLRCKGVGVDPEHPRFLDAVDDRMVQSERWFRDRQALLLLLEQLQPNLDGEAWLEGDG